jgi:outer membrane protein, adhesin transport system
LRKASPTSSVRRRTLRQGIGAAAAAIILGSGAGAPAQQASYGPPSPPGAAPAGILPAPPGISPALAAGAEQAVRTYPSVRAAEASIRASEADIRAAKWLRYPSVSVEAAPLDLTGDSNSTIAVEQPIWAGGRISATIERAEALTSVAEAQLDETARDIVVRLTNAYFEIARSIRREALLEESLKEHQRLVESMKRRVDQEVSPRSDLDLAQSRTAQIQQELSLTTAQRYAALQRFLELVGEPTFELGNVPRYDPAVHHPAAEGAIAEAIACDPRRQRLAAEVEVAEADRRISEAQIFPQLSAQYARNEVIGDRVGLVLRAQTNGGLSSVSTAQAARLRARSSELQVGVAERELREAVILDLVENNAARNRIESSSLAAESAQAVTESFVRQFITGRRTWLDVMNAVREATTARLGETEAEVSAMASSARILLRTCRWQPDLAGVAGR